MNPNERNFGLVPRYRNFTCLIRVDDITEYDEFYEKLLSLRIKKKIKTEDNVAKNETDTKPDKDPNYENLYFLFKKTDDNDQLQVFIHLENQITLTSFSNKIKKIYGESSVSEISVALENFIEEHLDNWLHDQNFLHEYDEEHRPWTKSQKGRENNRQSNSDKQNDEKCNKSAPQRFTSFTFTYVKHGYKEYSSEEKEILFTKLIAPENIHEIKYYILQENTSDIDNSIDVFIGIKHGKTLTAFSSFISKQQESATAIENCFIRGNCQNNWLNKDNFLHKYRNEDCIKLPRLLGNKTVTKCGVGKALNITATSPSSSGTRKNDTSAFNKENAEDDCFVVLFSSNNSQTTSVNGNTVLTNNNTIAATDTKNVVSDAGETSTDLHISEKTKSNNLHTPSNPSIIDKAADNNVTDDNIQQVTDSNENNKDSSSNMDVQNPDNDDKKQVFV
jgi:hypothetical protein